MTAERRAAAREERGEAIACDTPAWLPLRSYSLAAALVASVFAAVSVILFVFSAIGTLTVITGLAAREFWVNPVSITLMTLIGSAILTAVVFQLVRAIAVKPLHAMLAALDQLRHGNFDVRVKSSGTLTLREIEMFEESFNATAESLGQVELLRAGFVDDFSHEFNTPINSICGFAELLQGEGLGEDERREYLGIIAAESRRLSTMARSVLQLRQAESLAVLPQGELERVQVDEELRRSVLLAAEKWASKELAFELELAEESCEGSPALLGHVWSNLLDNACKFSPQGGTVRVTLEREGGRLRLSVENDGPPIAPEAQERLFDRFYQADSSHAGEGCGLGLAMVKRVCELHGAQIAVKSSPDGHTTFTVTLPQTAS